MANFKCKMCGAPLDVPQGQTVVTCEFCQSKQTVSNADDERKESLFNRANSLRAACDFDKALLAYQTILSLFPNEPEAHWGLCLCKYGIEYVSDPLSHGKIPTIHRMSFDSILKDSDYITALSNADVIAKEEYEEEAKQISNIQNNILTISQKEEPFDIFICYKETDEHGKRTRDSVMAQEIYSNLVDKGYKVFFSRITLESKLGSMYEPYIFAALNSAKIMLVIGTKKEYFDAIWVRNEWSRFIDLMKVNPDRYLIPCYKDMDAYEMPEQFLVFQGQNMGKLGFMQDLLRGIDKIIGKNNSSGINVETPIIQSDRNISSLLKRAEILISDSDFEKADDVLERVLDDDPTNSQAYLLKLFIDYNVNTAEDLKRLDKTINNNKNYKKAYNFGNAQLKEKLNEINNCIETRINNKLANIYEEAEKLRNIGSFEKAIEKYKYLEDYKDAKLKIDDCIFAKEQILEKAINTSRLYDNDVKSYLVENDFKEAKEIISKIDEYTDAEDLINQCHIALEKYAKEIADSRANSFNPAAAIAIITIIFIIFVIIGIYVNSL